ncbi:MAG TPA: molecular chaperone TorD family protein [Casimicrobiaceae bacterium]|nr:molecular chaperone TorD family protein [Casimicrobiaceae bacterium]
METAQLASQHRLEPEDEARGQFYALLARLYGSAPDATLLAALGGAENRSESPDSPLGAAWNTLVAASRAMDPAAAEQEYTDLFVGVGKAECNLHASHWLREAAATRPLVAVRADLAELGLARQGGTAVYEDHLAALCETMRALIAGVGDRPPVSVAAQRVFFERHVAPWVFDCCNAICNCSLANYYRRVAEFTSLYMAVERDSLAIG